ncbi:hypothetical protein [Corynebacterium ulceribovis]|uniref:hypothetical protein n=1 Tax=Corynebacterium ulceribovis TaxID=487732 RepID=UPI00035F3390|nr:hypothetical protein [Corynebacterium ulceribovis]
MNKFAIGTAAFAVILTAYALSSTPHPALLIIMGILLTISILMLGRKDSNEPHNH